MASVFDKAKWIWPTQHAEPDEYAEFVESVEFSGERAVLYISADSNYVVYVNGIMAAFGQYPDYPYDKVYDERDLTPYVRRGNNVIAIRVWYYGLETSQTYYPGEAGVIYAIERGGVNVCNSSVTTLSRISNTYINHRRKIITNQLGYSFAFDANNLDDWMHGYASEVNPFHLSFETGASLPLRPRSCLSTVIGETYVAKEVTGEGISPQSSHGRIFDLGKEVVGFICLDFISREQRPLTVAFGEHIADGHVRRTVGGRDFSFEYMPNEGRNYYINPFRRIGARYIELITDEPLSSIRIAVRSVDYPVTELPAPEGLTPEEERIYNASVHTLRCCMHEHYEDCPWREQALYTMDSRNQMLSGYYAFAEYVFPRANLELIASDNRPDGLLSICYPMKGTLAIPSFSLHFVLQCEEYLRYSGDVEFIRRIYPKIRSVLYTFVDKIGDNGLVAPFSGEGMWNFYEWQKSLDGREQLSGGRTPEGLEPDIVLNALLSLAIDRFMKIESALSVDSGLRETRARLNSAIYSHFLDKERGIFRDRRSTEGGSRLGNSLAILAGVVDGEERARLAKLLTEDTVSDATLSMRIFYYDALLATDSDGYKDYILGDIEKIYTPMLDMGTNTVWETVLGESDFDNAGSLCHGWSAIPVYYYHILKG